MRSTVATLIRLRLPPWLRRARTYPLIATLPAMQGALLVIILIGASAGSSGPLGRTLEAFYAALVALAMAYVLLVQCAFASGALLREGQDDELAQLAAGGAGPDELYAGALLCELCRGLLIVWAAAPVLALGALLFRPELLLPMLALLLLSTGLGAACGVAASAVAPSRWAAVAIAVAAVTAVATATLIVGARLQSARLPGVELAPPLLMMTALTLGAGLVGLWALRLRGLALR